MAYGHDVKDNIGDISQLPKEKSMDKTSDRTINLHPVEEMEEIVREISGEDLSWLGEVNNGHKDKEKTRLAKKNNWNSNKLEVGKCLNLSIKTRNGH